MTFLLRYVTNYGAPLIWGGLVCNILACIGAFFKCESPAWLLSVGEEENAKNNLLFIAKFNGVKDLKIDVLFPDPDSDAEEEEPELSLEEMSPSINKDGTRIKDEITEENKVEEKQKKDKKIGFCSNPKTFWTLVLFIVFWSASSFTYYILTFLLKYIPGNIFVNTSVGITSEIVANLAAGYIMKSMGMKPSFIIAFICTAAGAVLMICFFDYDKAMAAFVLLSKFGSAFAFCIDYLATPRVFPITLTGSAFGICNIFARLITVLSPVTAELPFPAPMSILAVAALVAGFCALFVKDR